MLNQVSKRCDENDLIFGGIITRFFKMFTTKHPCNAKQWFNSKATCNIHQSPLLVCPSLIFTFFLNSLD